MVPLFTETEIPFLAFPLFVVTIIAPLSPRLPYNADAVAPLRILMLSISSEGMSRKLMFPNGTPSMTNIGFSPRISIVGSAINSVLFNTNKPATLPVSEVPTSNDLTFCNPAPSTP